MLEFRNMGAENHARQRRTTKGEAEKVGEMNLINYGLKVSN